MTLNNKKGFTLIELLVVIGIISILIVVVLPQFSSSKVRFYDTDARSNLRNIFHACTDFWTFNSNENPCLLTTVSNNEYGFKKSADVEVTIEIDANNTEKDFYATASHTSSSNIFVINYRGVISNANAGGGGGNNGQGCSEEAQNDPQNLGGNAAGGCGTSGGNN